MTYEFLKTLYSDCMLMLKKIVVKRNDLAQQYETVDTVRDFDLYYACLTGSRYFYNFKRFDVDILEKFLSPADVTRCYADPNLIPEEHRAAIVELQAQRVIDTFEEQNTYYRELNGLPAVDDHYWIYVEDDPRIPSDVPIHQLSVEQVAYLEVTGKLDEIKEQHSGYKYLDYLGANKIDIIDARLAKPFEILRLGSPSNNMVKPLFEKEYYKARRYVMATCYNRLLFNNKTLYDPIMGVIMLTMAIRNVLVPTEFEYLYFEEVLDAILESYGLLEYFKNFPFTFKRRLVLALDHILQNKGTDGVLVDICKIFSMENFEAKRYFLMKTNAKDEDGNLIFDPDPEKQYDLRFVKAPIAEHDIRYAPDDLTPYETVVNNDYLWQLTPEEKESLLTEDFNLMMAKYIDIEATYDLSYLTFEVCYFLNLLLHSKDNLMKIYCTNMYAVNAQTPVYTMIVFLLAALAKRSGFDGNIVYEPDAIAEVLRFNSDDVRDVIQEITNKYEHQIDVNDSLLPDFESPIALQFPVGQVKDYQVLDNYLYNRALYRSICKEMNETNDIRKFTALYNAKQCLYYSYMQEQDFKKLDGSPAATYHELLAEIDPVLCQKLDDIDMEKSANDLDRMLIYILEKLEDLFSSDELQYLFLNTPSTYGSLIEKYLRMAINVFKASSVQLDTINVFFSLGEHDPIRIIDHKIKHMYLGVDDTVFVDDEISMAKTIAVDDTVYALEKAYYNT